MSTEPQHEPPFEIHPVEYWEWSEKVPKMPMPGDSFGPFLSVGMVAENHCPGLWRVRLRFEFDPAWTPDKPRHAIYSAFNQYGLTRRPLWQRIARFPRVAFQHGKNTRGKMIERVRAGLELAALTLKP